METRSPSIRQRYGLAPIFRDDREFLPLQGADLWAWWVRKWYDEGAPSKMADPDFGIWKANRERHVKLAIEFDEEALVDSLLSVAADHVPPNHFVMDTGYSHGMKFRRGNGTKWKEAVDAFDPRRMRR